MIRVSLKDAQGLSGQNRRWAYNALDCIATREIADVLLPRMTKVQARFYAFERAAQGPAFAMSRRGILIDKPKRAERRSVLKAEAREAIKQANRHPTVHELWDGSEKVTGACPKSTRKDGRHTWAKGEADTPARRCVNCARSRFKRLAFNPNSTMQCAHLLFDLLGCKVTKGKDGKISTDDECLKRTARSYVKAREICELILVVRGLKKRIGFLKTKLTPGGRFASTFTVGQAWTGRWSATKNAYREGGNAQNVAEQERVIFVADPGKELCYADLKQAESNIVAHVAGDEEYIRAHLEGDVHTYVTRLVWPGLEWTGDLAQDKIVAKQSPDWDPAPGHNFRFQSKRIQHGGNFGLTPYGVARIAHIPVFAAREAVAAYHGAFPGIREWQRSVARIVGDRGELTFPLGFTIKLFGRPWDDHTVKQGLAVIPQGTVAHIINIAAWRIWRHMDPDEVEVLAQVHDAVMFQFPKGRYDLARKAVALMSVPLEVRDVEGNVRVTIIEVEAACGLNWGHRSDENPNGIEEITL